MKELEHYLGATCSDSCLPAIMNETLAIFLYLEMPTTIPDMDTNRANNDADMTYIEKKNTNEAIR